MKLTIMKLKKKYEKYTVSIFATSCILVLLIVAGMTLKNNYDLNAILRDSVESQLISTSIAAREILDVEAFVSYNSTEDAAADSNNYQHTLEQLKQLAHEVGAEYIYALKLVDEDTGLFIFDTDTENEEVFIEYELSDTHITAFRGEESAGVLNLIDEYGSHNTGAVPIFYNGRVVGIMCTDTADVHIQNSNKASTFNFILLIALLILSMTLMVLRLRELMKNVKQMQSQLEHDAHYDVVTGLPNRKYLLEYLDATTTAHPNQPFAMLFIDLDNFKLVNDTAGHDAGDELLKHIAEFLERSSANAKSFRPAAGRLNIAARVGGDEFIQIVHGIGTEEEATAVVTELLERFHTEDFDRYVKKFKVGMSIGVSLYPYHSDNCQVLIKYADIAMYNSKRAGKNTASIYTDEMEGKKEK